MRDNWCDWCMVFRCAWAKVVELDLHQRCTLGTCLRMWPRKCPGSPYILCLCLPKTSVCQRYSNVSSALMGKELKDPLTSFDLFETSDLHDLHVSAQIKNSWCWFLQLRPVEDIHIMTGRWQMHCRFIVYSFDSLSTLSICHFVSFPVAKGRKVAKHQHSSSTLEPARYETQRWTGNCWNCWNCYKLSKLSTFQTF